MEYKEFAEKFVEEFNETFGEPFLPRGFAKAYLTDYGTIWIDIGNRDSEFNEKGIRTGSGSRVGDGREWEIHHV